MCLMSLSDECENDTVDVFTWLDVVAEPPGGDQCAQPEPGAAGARSASRAALLPRRLSGTVSTQYLAQSVGFVASHRVPGLSRSALIRVGRMTYHASSLIGTLLQTS